MGAEGVQAEEGAGKVKHRSLHGRKFGFLGFFNVLVMVYLLLPIAIIILYSFNLTAATMFPLPGFTTKWYVEVVQNRSFLQALKNSVYVGLAVAFISVIIGSLASFALTRYDFKLKRAVSFSVLIPITLPAIILGISLLSFFASIGLQRSLFTVILGHSVFCIPFAVLVMNSRLEGFDISVEEAARDLGADTVQTFRYVTFPIIRPSIIGVIMLTFALSFDEFLVTFFIVGKENTLPIVVWGMLRRGVSPTINVIATMVLVFSMTLIVIANKYAKIRTLH
jgi:spermidine/putrescine transport system permease protein